jgi:hypothetical protein
MLGWSVNKNSVGVNFIPQTQTFELVLVPFFLTWYGLAAYSQGIHHSHWGRNWYGNSRSHRNALAQPLIGLFQSRCRRSQILVKPYKHRYQLPALCHIRHQAFHVKLKGKYSLLHVPKSSTCSMQERLKPLAIIKCILCAGESGILVIILTLPPPETTIFSFSVHLYVDHLLSLFEFLCTLMRGVSEGPWGGPDAKIANMQENWRFTQFLITSYPDRGNLVSYLVIAIQADREDNLCLLCIFTRRSHPFLRISPDVYAGCFEVSEEDPKCK